MRTTLNVDGDQKETLDAMATALRKYTGENWSAARVARLAIKLGVARIWESIEKGEIPNGKAERVEERPGI